MSVPRSAYTLPGGATISASLIPGIGSYGMALLGGNLFVAQGGAGTIGKYDATTGAQKLVLGAPKEKL